MKNITCLDCNQKFVGGSTEEVMKMMMPHYMESHKDVMEKGNEQERAIWMKKFNTAWDNAKEI